MNQGQQPGLEPHPYCPLRVGLEWEYRSTARFAGSELPSAKHRERITDVRVENAQTIATVTTQYEYNKEATATHRLVINRDGLSPDQTPMGVAGATVQASGVQGIVLPRDPKAGQRWTYTLQFETQHQVYKINATVEVADSGPIEVPAGRFDTVRLFSTVKTRITAKAPFTLPGGIQPPFIEQTQIEETFWARGVGRARMVTRAATGYETLMDLVWFSPG
jgi:hypothetical protein